MYFPYEHVEDNQWIQLNRDNDPASKQLDHRWTREPTPSNQADIPWKSPGDATKGEIWNDTHEVLPSTSNPAPVQPGAWDPLPLGMAPIPLPLPWNWLFFFTFPSPSTEGCWLSPFTTVVFPPFPLLGTFSLAARFGSIEGGAEEASGTVTIWAGPNDFPS